MSDKFRKPFAAPPTIFGVALLFSVVFGLFFPFAFLPWYIQLVLGPVSILAGVFLIRSSIKEIEAAGTTYDPFDISTSLVTSGVYRYSRNPGYLGLGVIQFGFAILLDNVWIAIATFGAALITSLFVIKLEEEKLSNTFGEKYLAYKSRVRRWL